MMRVYQEQIKMEYRKFKNVIVARIDKDEEVLDKIKEINLKEKN